MSLLGLAGYDSDGSDGDDGNPRRSPQLENSSGSGEHEKGAASGGSANNLLEENSDSRLGESVDEEADTSREARVGVLRASSFDAPAPPSKESRQFFMPLPSPLVKLDNASPSATSPFIAYEPPDGAAEGDGAEGEEEKADEGDGDVIKPDYRDMLPPEATGQASPELQAKIAKLLNRKEDFTKVIKGKKDYGNPAVLAQVKRSPHTNPAALAQVQSRGAPCGRGLLGSSINVLLLFWATDYIDYIHRPRRLTHFRRRRHRRRVVGEQRLGTMYAERGGQLYPLVSTSVSGWHGETLG